MSLISPNKLIITVGIYVLMSCNQEFDVSEIGSKDYFCIFGGGAIRGLAYLGALRAMQEMNIAIKAFAGSSVGSVFAVFAAMNFSNEEFLKVFDEVNFELFRDVRFDIAKKFAISKGEHFLEWLRDNIEKKQYGESYLKGKNQPVTFKDIDTDCFVITANINGCEPYIFSKYTTPDFEVAKAIKISTSLPGLFEPYEFDNNMLVDGDMMKSWPMWKISDLLCPDDCRIIEFRLEGAKYWSETKNSVEYLNAVFATLSNFATDHIMQTYQPKDKFDYVKINTEHVLPVQFTLPQKDRENLINLGYDTTMDYFKKTLLMKKKELLPRYTMLLDSSIKIKNAIRSNKINDAKSYICEMFVHLCETKRYIDISIYDKAINFKDIFFENYKTSLLFKTPELKEKRLVEFHIDKLNDEVLERCMELQNYIDEIENKNQA